MASILPLLNGEGHKLQIRAIIVDLQTANDDHRKTDYYSYFDSFLNEETTSLGQIPAKEGRITIQIRNKWWFKFKNYYVG